MAKKTIEVFNDPEVFHKCVMKHCVVCDSWFDCDYNNTIEDIKNCLLEKLNNEE